MRIKFQAIFRLCPTTPAILLPHVLLVFRPVFKEFFLNERAFS